MTGKRLHWFHCYPEKWLTALSDMKPDVGYVYIIICFRIYEKRGPIPDSYEAIGRRTGYRPTHIARIVETLCSLGKLVRTESGALMNPFAERQIATQMAKGSREIDSPMANESPEKSKKNQRGDDTEIEVEIEVEEERTVARPKRTRTRTIFPVGWIPDQEQISYAQKRGFNTTQLALMWEAFGNHHTSRGNLMADWAAAWRTWVTNEIKFSANRKGNGNGRTVQQAAADLARKVRQFDEPAPSDIRDGEGAPVAGLLPQR